MSDSRRESPDVRSFDLRRLRAEAMALENECPNSPDEMGQWPCDPKGYFGVAECQVCGRIGKWPSQTGDLP
jgi:hypothetical protein